MSLKMYRQGDILLIEEKKMPKGGEVKPAGILVSSTVTGHKHRVEPLSKASVHAFENGVLYVKGTDAFNLVHDEHHTLAIPAGVYKLVRQQTHTPEGWRQVED